MISATGSIAPRPTDPFETEVGISAILTNILHRSDQLSYGGRAGHRQRAAFFVDRYWDRIERLAGALAEHGSLTGGEVDKLLRA
jgi:hypothetical protein